MSDNGRIAGEANSERRGNDGVAISVDESVARSRFAELQSAMRFPLKLQVAVKSPAGEQQTETENISANGVLFQIEGDMPVGSRVDFTISVPASVIGTPQDVRLDCRGRVVRSFEQDGRRGVGVVIEQYHLESR